MINVRTYSIIKSRDACFAAAPYKGVDLPADRREGLVFSAPTFLFFYHGLIAHKRAAESIKPYLFNGLVNFRALLSDKNIKGGFQPGRVYSRWLNEIFATDEGVENMFRWSGNIQLTQSMFKLMDAGRLDYFVDYYLLLRFHELSEGNRGTYNFYPLQEHKGQFGLGGIACHDTPVGRQLIADINAVLDTVRRLPEFRETNSRWLMPPGQSEQYWKLWQDELLARSD